MKLRYILLLFVAVLLVVGTCPSLSAQGAKAKAGKAVDPMLGTWKLNIEKSKIPPIPTAPKENTMVNRDLGDQNETTFTGIQRDGKPISQKVTFPKQGGAMQTQPALPEGISLVATNIDVGKLYVTVLANGKQVQVAHYAMSKDGKTTTTTIKGFDTTGKPFESIQLWEKQ